MLDLPNLIVGFVSFLFLSFFFFFFFIFFFKAYTTFCINPFSGQGIGHSRWWSMGVSMDPNSENAFPEGILWPNLVGLYIKTFILRGLAGEARDLLTVLWF